MASCLKSLSTIRNVSRPFFRVHQAACLNGTKSNYYSSVTLSNKFLTPTTSSLLSYDSGKTVRNGSLSVSRQLSAKQSTALPSLPVPELKETLDKYLRSVEPLLSAEELATTKGVVAEFLRPGGAGEHLQQKLVERAASRENWLSEWWLNNAYLDFRMPVMIWSSPGLVFPLQDFKLEQDQLVYAAKLIAGAVEYKERIATGNIAQEYMGKAPLDMSQYHKVFASCRVPGKTRDVIRNSMAESPRHIVVMRNNLMFSVPVYDDAGVPLEASALVTSLQQVVTSSATPGPAVGLLTAQNRDAWYSAHQSLLETPANAASLDSMQRSLFVVCLDTAPPPPGDAVTSAAHTCLHGGGVRGGSGNRWFDKTVQFVVGATGHCGLTYEHSPAEGPPIAAMMDHVVSYIEDCPALIPAPGPAPAPLPLMVSEAILGQIDVAGEAVDREVAELDMAGFQFQDFGKAAIKALKISPDSFIQMAIQLAYYRLHGTPAAHYESASLRMFSEGRTETVRSCSVESAAFCQAMAGEDREAAAAALRTAVTAHKAYVTAAVSGRGIDRHLLGLKLLADPVPELYRDVAYTRSGHLKLSTSQVAAKSLAFMCYGPLVTDGYGCCYNPQDDVIMFGTSCHAPSADTRSAAVFRDAVAAALRDMRAVLQ